MDTYVLDCVVHKRTSAGSSDQAWTPLYTVPGLAFVRGFLMDVSVFQVGGMGTANWSSDR